MAVGISIAASSRTVYNCQFSLVHPATCSASPPSLLFSPLSRRFRSSVLSSRRKPSLTVCFVLEDEKLESGVEIRAEEIEKAIEKQISAFRLAEKLARKRSERFTYLVATVMSSLGITSMAVLAVYYRFAWQMEGGEVPYTEMFGTFALSVGAAVGMEFWARWADTALWHASLWHIHQSHHRPREGQFELNDVTAVPAIALLSYGFFHKGLVPGLCFRAGLGITVFGMAYMFVYDGLVHKRFPVGPIADVPYFRRVAAAHQLHHTDKFNGVPYGLFLGPKTKIQEFIEPADRKCKGWIHFVGVGGCGLSALAMLALKQGFEVSGSDIIWSSYMDPLHEAGARLYIGHSEFNLLRNDGLSLPDAVVVSSAIPVDNVEILHAKARRVPVYKRGAWLGKITEGHNLIAVSGSHGKSTTASMLAYLLHAMGDDITAVVGAKVPQFDGGNIIYGTSNNFVLEADEYDYCFLGLRPHIAVVTNVDWEHVDIFQNEEEVRATFRQFVQQIRDGGHLILCGDSCAGAYISLCSCGKADTEPNISNEFETFPSSELCCDRYHITTYGVSSFNEWHASSIHPNSYGGSDYKLYHKGHYVADISLRMPGIHNIINSLAVIATVSIVASDEGFFDTITSLRSHLLNFRGICRRFEKVGTFCGCHIYDDYAHHPTEIRAVLQAARQRFPFTELLVIFQPHSYSRIAALKSEFATAFKDADQVVVTEVYAARETSHCTSGRDLARSIVCPSSEFIPSRETSHCISGSDLARSIVCPSSEFISSLDMVLDKLASLVWEDPDREIVILTLGAGDITTLGRKLLCELQLRCT